MAAILDHLNFFFFINIMNSTLLELSGMMLELIILYIILWQSKSYSLVDVWLIRHRLTIQVHMAVALFNRSKR